jgi:uncharacterized membrane protein
MTDNLPDTQEGARFEAVLHPHRFLGPTGLMVFMLAISTTSFVAGWLFLLAGIWPVLAFLVLALLALYAGFRLSARFDPGYEEIALTHEALVLVKVDGRGGASRHDFNPHWVAVKVGEDRNGATRLALASRGEEVEFGAVLDDFERREFAALLADKLLAARAGRPL